MSIFRFTIIQKHFRVWYATAILVIYLCNTICAVAQQQDTENYDVASGSKMAYQQAVKRIPWNQLSKNSQTKTKDIVNNYTIFRRMPQQAVYCYPEMYNFLLAYPHTVVSMWEQLGVTQIAVKEIGPDLYQMKETTGTVAELEVIYRSQNLCLIYGKGTYRGPVIKKAIDGDVLLILQSRFGKDKLGEPFVVSRMDAFVRIHNPGAELIAKLLTPVVGKIVDNNFEQTVAFVGNVSDASQFNPEIVHDMAVKLKGVHPEIKNQLRRTIDMVAANAMELEEVQESKVLVKIATPPETVQEGGVPGVFEPRSVSVMQEEEYRSAARSESMLPPSQNNQ